MKPLVIIPTYNEIDALPLTLDRIRAELPAIEILVVDDNSPDGTGIYAQTRGDDDSAIHVLHRPGKGGLAAAYIAGFSWALERAFTHVVQMDADGSHRASDLTQMLARADGADQPDLVIGSRWVPGGGVDGWPITRQVLSRAGNYYNRVALGLPYTDITAGFRVYRTDTLRRLDLESVRVVGYYWQTDMTQRLHGIGAHIVEHPITFHEREAGESKLSSTIFFESLAESTRRGARHHAARLTALLGR